MLVEFPKRPFEKASWPWDGSNTGSKTDRSDGAFPRITIVTPSFNQAQFLEETIRSVLLQDYPNLEYIVIDGGSQDGSIEIIRKYEPWLTYWISEADKGQAHAINKGFARATGEIMGYLNSDDILSPNALWQVRNAFACRKSKRGLVIAFAGVLFNCNVVKVVHPGPRQYLTSWLTTTHTLNQPSTFWSTCLYRAIGGFDENMTFSFDKDFFIQALFGYRSGDYVAKPEFVASWFRLHESSKTSIMVTIHEDENKIIQDRYRSQEPYTSILVREAKTKKHEEEVLYALSSSDFSTAFLHLLKAVILMPGKVLSRFYIGACRRVAAKIFR